MVGQGTVGQGTAESTAPPRCASPRRYGLGPGSNITPLQSTDDPSPFRARLHCGDDVSGDVGSSGTWSVDMGDSSSVPPVGFRAVLLLRKEGG